MKKVLVLLPWRYENINLDILYETAKRLQIKSVIRFFFFSFYSTSIEKKMQENHIVSFLKILISETTYTRKICIQFLLFINPIFGFLNLSPYIFYIAKESNRREVLRSQYGMPSTSSNEMKVFLKHDSMLIRHFIYFGTVKFIFQSAM